MPDLERDLFERRGHQRQRGDIIGMPVARDHLRSDGRRPQSQPLADALFGLRADMPESSHRARNLSHPHALRGGGKAREIALDFVVPQRQLQPESDRLGMDAVRSSDLHRVFELERARLQDLRQLVDALENQLGRAAHHQGLRGVDDVVGGQPVMQPARRVGLAGRGQAFGNRGGERDDVVLDLALDFMDALQIEAGMFAKQARRLWRHVVRFGQRFGGGQLHFQPLAIFVLLAPDARHLRAGVACDHLIT